MTLHFPFVEQGIHLFRLSKSISFFHFRNCWRFSLSFIAAFVAVLSIAQEGSTEDSYLSEIEAVKTCVMSQGSDCDIEFSQAIALARSIENDSLLGHCYLSIFNTQKALGMGYEAKWKVLNEASELLEGKKYSCLHALIISEKGNTVLDHGIDEDYMAYYNTAVERGDNCDDARTLSMLRMAKSRGLQSRGQLVKAIDVLLEAEKIATEYQDTASLAQVKMGLGNVYNLNEDNELAREQFKKSADLVLATGDTLRYWYVMVNYANCCNTLDEPEAAIEVLPSAIRYMKGAGMDYVVPYAVSQLGRAYGLQGQEKDAIVEFKASAEMCETQGNVAQAAYNYLCIAEMNKRLGNTSEALEYAEQSYVNYKGAGMLADLMDAAEIRAEMLDLNGEHEAAVVAYREFLQLKDSLYSDSKMKEISALQAALELEERENEICAQEAEITNLELDNKASRNRNLFLFASLLSLAALAYALISRQRLKIAAQKSIVREKQHENEKLNQELAYKNRELTAKALHIAQKNQVLQKLQDDLRTMANEKGANECVREVVSTLKLESAIDKNWDQFTQQFKELNPDFYKNLNEHTEGLGKSDLRLAALLRMNMTSKEIASMLNISDEGIKKARYRLRKKLDLQSEESLEAKIMAI